MTPDENNIEEVLKRALPSASQEQREAARERIYNRARSAEPLHDEVGHFVPTPSRNRRGQLVVAAAAVLALGAALSVPFARSLISPDKVYAIVETGSVYRVEDAKNPVSVGEKISAGTRVRTDDATAAVLKLPDGASIEMQAKSEVSLEPTEDGVRIRITDGSVRVTPSKQPGANLYVQNRETTVPVVGAVFQSAAPPALVPQNPVPPGETFEVVSVRPSNATRAVAGERGTSGGVAIIKGCTNPPRVDPSQFVAVNSTLYNLISFAYGYGCPLVSSLDLVTHGPAWIKSDLFDIKARIPEGVFTAPVRIGDPKLQAMLQSMLADRFKLVIRREIKERPGYVLALGKGAPKLVAWKEGDKVEDFTNRAVLGLPPPETYLGTHLRYDDAGRSYGVIVGRKVTVSALTNWMRTAVYRPVEDQTGITGFFNFDIEYDNNGLARPVLPVAIQVQLGLKLEDTKTSGEVLVIETVEKPTEN